MKKRRLISSAIALLLAVCMLPLSAFAAEWYLEDGDITVSASENGQTVKQGSKDAVTDNNATITQRDSSTATSNTITISASGGAAADVTIKDTNINTSGAAISSTGEGDVTIELDGVNNLQSGKNRAGLEKSGDGTLTITDTDNNGTLTASGGAYGAGIGGGDYGNGSNITISGGTVNAAGGYLGAGIGGGYMGFGNNITISGGMVNAVGNDCSAGIGGGYQGFGINITISGSAQVTARAGKGDYADGAGSAIGNGGGGCGVPYDGAEVTPDTSGLYTTGRVERLNPDGTVKGTITGTVEPPDPAKPVEPAETETVSAKAEALYRVTDKDGNAIAHKAERKDGVLTITVDADYAILTGKLSGIKTLEGQGIEEIVFVTSGAASTFETDDLLEQGGETYQLTHDGKTVTFTAGAKQEDVSEILE